MPDITRDYACLIHGDTYSWDYVENLYSMLRANSAYNVRLHVYTEPNRSVPNHMVHHPLTPWAGVSGPRRAWWYKMQMFNPQYFAGMLMYLDLDVVIVKNIDWIWNLNTEYFWAIHDFRRLWRPTFRGINSSVMFWNTQRYDYVWKQFSSQDLSLIMRRWQGDQDFLTSTINKEDCQFFNTACIKSWRWEINDGGLDVKTRKYRHPGVGTVKDSATSIMIFHGAPKPHEITDPVIQKYWNLNPPNAG